MAKRLVSFYYDSGAGRKLRFVLEDNKATPGYISGVDLCDQQYKKFIDNKAVAFNVHNVAIGDNSQVYSLNEIFSLAGKAGGEALFEFADRNKVVKYLSEQLKKNVVYLRDNFFLVQNDSFLLVVMDNYGREVGRLTLDGSNDKVTFYSSGGIKEVSLKEFVALARKALVNIRLYGESN